MKSNSPYVVVLCCAAVACWLVDPRRIARGTKVWVYALKLFVRCIKMLFGGWVDCSTCISVLLNKTDLRPIVDLGHRDILIRACEVY